MTPFGSRARSTALTLVVAAAACADGATPAEPPSRAVPTESASDAGGAPPKLHIRSSGGVTGYQFDVDGTGFPPGKGYEAAVLIEMLDGTRIRGAAAIGVNPGDGSFRLVYTGFQCPSRFRDVYASVTSAGRTTETEHVVPPC